MSSLDDEELNAEIIVDTDDTLAAKMMRHIGSEFPLAKGWGISFIEHHVYVLANAVEDEPLIL